jgi:hypothetical protein
MDFGPDPEKDFDDITPYEKLIPKKTPHEAKPEIKGKILKMQEPVTKEEHELKDGCRVKTLIKPKVEADKDIDDSHQVQVLKKKFKFYSCRSSIISYKESIKGHRRQIKRCCPNLLKKNFVFSLFLSFSFRHASLNSWR